MGKAQFKMQLMMSVIKDSHIGKLDLLSKIQTLQMV